jgi:signal transduction histidine kinase
MPEEGNNLPNNSIPDDSRQSNAENLSVDPSPLTNANNKEFTTKIQTNETPELNVVSEADTDSQEMKAESIRNNLSTIDEDTSQVVQVPFRTDINNWAVLEIKRSDLERNLGREEQTLIKQVTEQLSLALENAHLFQQTQQLANELQILYEMARALSEKMDKQYIAEAVYKHTSRLINLNYFSLCLYSQDTQTLTFPLVFYNDNRINIAERPLGKGVGEYVIQAQKPLLFSKNIGAFFTSLNIEEDSSTPTEDIRCLMCVPLLLGNNILGFMEIFNTKEENIYTEHHLSLMTSIASQSAIALENAHSYELAQLAITEMRELDILKSQFLANMSHELRTPLNSIIGFSRVILKGIDGPISELQEQDLNAIYSSGQHLLRLINDILDFSKMDANKMEISLEDVNLVELLENVIPTIGGLLKDKQVEIVKEIPPELPIIRADPVRIRQVMINLLSNAAKFTEKGSITITAGTEVSDDNKSYVKVQVSDTGLGISDEDQIKLFQPFSQVDSSPTRRSGGTGLGLSISKKLIELHGGFIGVISRQNEGSTFYFTLPINR